MEKQELYRVDDSRAGTVASEIEGVWLTKKQVDVMLFIARALEQRHYPPTYEEVRVELGLSTKSLVSYYLSSLERKGLIGHKARVARAMWLTEKGMLFVKRLETHGA